MKAVAAALALLGATASAACCAGRYAAGLQALPRVDDSETIPSSARKARTHMPLSFEEAASLRRPVLVTLGLLDRGWVECRTPGTQQHTGGVLSCTVSVVNYYRLSVNW